MKINEIIIKIKEPECLQNLIRKSQV